MKATAKQIARMTEEVQAINEDIAALTGGASLKALGVPKGVSREEAIKGWAERKAAIEAKMTAGEAYPL